MHQLPVSANAASCLAIKCDLTNDGCNYRFGDHSHRPYDQDPAPLICRRDGRGGAVKANGPDRKFGEVG